MKLARYALPLFVAVAITSCGGEDGVLSGAGKKRPIHLAATTCTLSTYIEDKGDSIFLDLPGEDWGSGELLLGPDDVECMLRELDAPDRILRSMYNTRALDGAQTATWGVFKAEWRYHPDDGLDVLIWVDSTY